MTYRDENIVNISMIAAELLKDGKIQRDDISGHAGFTVFIINLAEKFERDYTDVNYEAGERDYWEDIDAFAERELIDQFGVEHIHEQELLDIKVIIDNGITEAVLKNQQIPVNVEIVDINDDYEDYEQLNAYRNQLYADNEYHISDHTTAHFTEEELEEAFGQAEENLDDKISSAEERHQEQLNRFNQHRTQKKDKEEERD